ncbi:hypothetical protein Lalb_Chr22g0358611 [Lupinus albus]|uniref:Uncharacterized protein n=1 Tax=Lupinus albus TaxID=3870 RepID=A0A6A4N9N7_LUPAL|nr:hypothetical protein Lalb_Chr22g0358611 [Lupinus albus]
MHKHRFQLGLQTRFKLRTLGPFVHLQFRVRAKSGQFFKFGRIFSHRQVTLFQPQEFHLFLTPQISRKILPKKFLPECTPENHLPFSLHLAPSEFSLVLGLLHKHIGSIRQFLSIRTAHSLENPLQSLNPFYGSIRSEPTLKLTGVPPAEFIQSSILSLTGWNQRL